LADFGSEIWPAASGIILIRCYRRWMSRRLGLEALGELLLQPQVVMLQASAVSGAFSEGFQTTGSPQMKASAVFQDYTATGKLNADITPQTPSGCQVSIIR
jgi:hypothetical protein